MKLPVLKKISATPSPVVAKRNQKIANPVGRPVGRDSSHTKLGILDVAEALFSIHGYEGTSIRDVAKDSNIQAALVGYHYGTKLDLFNAVVSRRSKVINEARSQALAIALLTKKGKPLPIETLIELYVYPLLEATSHGDQGWRNFASLMGRLANSPRGTEMINLHFNEVVNEYIAEFRRSLPTLEESQLVDGFLYMVSAMLFVCADTGRYEAIVKSKSDQHRSVQEVLRPLVAFVAGGFKALLADGK
jgi:AcrR family transcriptional regulator